MEKQKIEMTEDQANEIYSRCVMEQIGTSREGFIDRMKNSGYIRKSELEIMIEEAEEMYKNSIKDCANIKSIPALIKQNELIQALIKENERLKSCQ